jgi:hypothetical protein
MESKLFLKILKLWIRKELPLMTKTGFEYIDLITLIVVSELICNTFVMKNIFGRVAVSNVIRFQTHTQEKFTQLLRLF